MHARKAVIGLILFFGLLVVVVGAGAATDPSAGGQAPSGAWTLQGRVYHGELGDPSEPIQNVTIEVYGANTPLTTSATLIRSTATNEEGWYGLTVWDDDGFWNTYYLHEIDPPNRTSTGATSVDGDPLDDNWIEFSGPLEGQDLTGNKFWDQRQLLQGKVYRGPLGDTSTPIPGVTVELYCSGNEGVLGSFVLSTTTNADGWYGLEPAVGCEWLNIQEVDPPLHSSVDAATISGTVQGPNWIAYMTPLDGQILTGNRFWDQLDSTVGWLKGAVMDAELNGDDPVCTPAVVEVQDMGIEVPADLETGAYGPVALEEDTYALTARAAGYAPQTVTGVSIVGDMTTTIDFPLVRPQAELIAPEFLTFSLVISQPASAAITVANHGSQPLGVELVEGGGEDLPWVSEDPVSATVSAGGQVPVDLSFHCTEPGEFNGVLIIDHDDPCQGPFVLPMQLICRHPEPEWSTNVAGQLWFPDLVIPSELGDSIAVVDVLTYAHPSDLISAWDPDRLQLAGDTIVQEAPPVYTVTRIFSVRPCTWTETILTQTLNTGELAEDRPTLVTKAPPDLWLTSANRPAVMPGELATFTLTYGNAGGYENNVWIWNDFPPTAPFAWSIPSPDEVGQSGRSARWNLGDLAGGTQAEILVAIAISPTVEPPALIEIFDQIFDHADQGWEATVVTFTVEQSPEVEWAKWVDDVRWWPGMAVARQTSDTLAVVDVFTGELDFDLVETWNPGELELLGWTVDPPDRHVFTETGLLVLEGRPEGIELVTLTKHFRVLPCNWEATVLNEELYVAGTPDPLFKPTLIEKVPDYLWIDTFYDPEVQAGQRSHFILEYGNAGGRELEALIRTHLPVDATFVESIPPPDHQDQDSLEWVLPMLEMGQVGIIEVVVDIASSLPPSHTVEILTEFLDHSREPRSAAETLFHIASPVTFPDGDWPRYAQEEITVDPEPPVAGQPTHLCAEVINRDPLVDRPALFQFGVSDFGIGFFYEPVGETEVLVPAGGSARGCVVWVPPDSREWFIEVRLITGDSPDRISRRNLDMNEPLERNTPHERVFPVVNPYDGPVTITLEHMAHLAWDIDVTPATLTNVQPGEIHSVTLTVTPPDDLPQDGQPIVDVEAHVGEELMGGFRKIYRPPVPLHRFSDPPYAEREIIVHPYPLRAGEPTEVCVELRNPTGDPQDLEVQFSWSRFGIGMQFTPINGLRPVHLPPHSIVRECIHWIPPLDGQHCLQVEVLMEGHQPQRSRLNLDVNEPLVAETAHAFQFPVRNPFAEPMTITLQWTRGLPGWGLELDPIQLVNVPGGLTRTVTLTATPPDILPPDGTPVVDVEAHIGDQLIGGFRKIYRPPVPLHRFPDPPYAEREITVHPYPPRAGEPTEVCVELRNPTGVPQNLHVQFAWSHFGIGMAFTPINGLRPVHLPPYSIVRECIHWVPPIDGQVCLQVELLMEGYQPQRSRLNLDVDEPLQAETPHALRFPVRNPFAEPMNITLGLVPLLPGWSFELDPDHLAGVPGGMTRTVTLTVTPPATMPPDETPIVDVQAYSGDLLIGGIRKVYRPPVPIHRPRDPIYAESEITIQPYPPRAGEPTELGVELHNPTNQPQNVSVQFSWSDLGIGLQFYPIGGPISVTIPAGGTARPTIWWVPHRGGQFCIQVDLWLLGHDQPVYSQRNLDVNEILRPNTPSQLVFQVGNPFDHDVTITLGLIPHLPWPMHLSPDILTDIPSGETRPVTLTITPTGDLSEDGHPIVDVEAYVDGELLGGVRKIYRPPVPIHRPRDPVYAESEIGVDPYPILPGQPTKLSVEVFNPTSQDQVVTATFEIAAFGIGMPFTTSHITPNPIQIYVPAHGAARGHVIWHPPMAAGQFCVQVTLQVPDHEPFWSQRNVDVGEPLERGVPHSLEFPVSLGQYTQTHDIELALINHRPGWEMSLSHTALENVDPNSAPVTVTLTVTAPTVVQAGAAASDELLLGTGRPIADVEAYVDGRLLGGFRKLDRPPVPLHKPHEKGYAETEIVIDPYPPQEGVTTTVGAVLQNTSDQTSTVVLEFGWARFGMGIPFTTTGMSPVTETLELSPGITGTAEVTWTPSVSGHQCLLVRMTDPLGRYEPQQSQRNVDVSERPPCGITKEFTFTVYNDSPFTATIDVGMITFNVPPDWQVTVSPTGTIDIAKYSQQVVTVTVTIPCPPSQAVALAWGRIAALQEAAGGVPTIDVEGYKDGQLVGGIEIQFPPPAEPPRMDLFLPLVLRSR